MGMTSTGSGKAPSDSTSLLSSMMQTKLSEAAAIDLLAGERGAAALDQHAVGGGFVGTVDVEVQIAGGIQIELRNARRLQRKLSEVWRELETAPAELDFTVFQHFDEFVDGRAGADAEHHAALRCRGARLPRRGVFFALGERIFRPLKTTVPAYAGTVDYFRRLTFS